MGGVESRERGGEVGQRVGEEQRGGWEDLEGDSGRVSASALVGTRIGQTIRTLRRSLRSRAFNRTSRHRCLSFRRSKRPSFRPDSDVHPQRKVATLALAQQEETRSADGIVTLERNVARFALNDLTEMEVHVISWNQSSVLVEVRTRCEAVYVFDEKQRVWGVFGSKVEGKRA